MGDAGNRNVNPKVLPIVSLVARRLGAGLERLIRELKLRQSASLPSVGSEAPDHLSSARARQQTDVQRAVDAEANRLLEQVEVPEVPVRAGMHAFTSRDWELPDDFEAPWPDLSTRDAATQEPDDAGRHSAMLTPTGEFSPQPDDEGWDDADDAAEPATSGPGAGGQSRTHDIPTATETSTPSSRPTRDLPVHDGDTGAVAPAPAISLNTDQLAANARSSPARARAQRWRGRAASCLRDARRTAARRLWLPKPARIAAPSTSM